ncbi:2-polyprenyl-6-methoxyphenol hydroxylase-like FAD-dependent oxidoreductase [Kribbella amoyensis]|uniref:2-polyprenyl-6-methoxyphenol hydroxylase-like FAD-dependent oxidoreductase n=1 Tax=Kribbella amoyensis TaxID=996641 RepID=A0A561BTN9_9ACTN|nr:FAD-dependent monooxygenase [Kribbella amoyensis]TWD82173.1 2-polyprenyl-6-methoxyphenol hydroxylase-like FAD-dependent oxidoreductase [Kribbella amoyensis]
MSAQYDVVVVGARVAGAATALLLARAGARVALVDRNAYGSDTISTHGLMRGAVLQLSRWGLLDEVVRAGTPRIERTLFHYADSDPEQVAIRATPGVDALYAPRRHVLDRILVDAAAKAGVHVHHEVKVTELLQNKDERVLGVRGQDRTGRNIELHATVTVGADGLRSTVASLAGAEVVERGRTRSAVLYRYYAGARPAGYELAYSVGSAAGFIPTNDGQTCVFVATTPDHLRTLRRDGADQAFSALLTDTAPHLADRIAAADPESRLTGWAGVANFVRRSGGPGWALVGDAGYFKDPITMHGITDGLRDAELLADQLVAVLGGQVPESVALTRYQAIREHLSRAMIGATEAVAAYTWDLDQVRVLLREVSSAMSDEVEHLQTHPAPPLLTGDRRA